MISKVTGKYDFYLAIWQINHFDFNHFFLSYDFFAYSEMRMLFQDLFLDLETGHYDLYLILLINPNTFTWPDQFWPVNRLA